MLDNTQKRIAVITGAGRGIGRAAALAFAQRGIVPVILDIDSEAAERTAAEVRKGGVDSEAYTVDITSVEQIQSAFKTAADRFGSIDILVNNAGVLSTAQIDGLTEDEWNRVMDINLKGAVFATQAALNFMIPRRWGRIINITSLSGRMGGLSSGVAYSVSKAALHGLTMRTARTSAEYGITVNAIAPGTANTEMVKGFTPEQLTSLISNIPIGKLVEPDAIAETAVFLASDAAQFITGAVIDINGGMFMG